MSEKEITVLHKAYHRNGIGGMGFYVLIFTDWDGRKMLGVVFPDSHGNFSVPEQFTNPYTAVFDMDLLAEDNIRFAENSWRGDVYDRPLREAITAEEPDDPEILTARELWTVLGVYADQPQRYATTVEAPDAQTAERIARDDAPAPLMVAGVIKGSVELADVAYVETSENDALDPDDEGR